MILGFTGDVSFNDGLEGDVFSGVVDQVPRDARLFVNFESTLHEHRDKLQPHRDKILVTSPVSSLSMLNSLPVAATCVANNHIGDYGNDIAAYTISQLASRWPTFGAGYEGEPFHHLIREIDGIRFGFLAYCTSDTSPLHAERGRIGPCDLRFSTIEEDLQSLRTAKVDHMIAIMHWGVEDLHHPLPTQRMTARRLIDCGVSLVVGSHAHAVQGYERYRGRYIFHGLGNFCFPHITTPQADGRLLRHRFLTRSRWGVVPWLEITRQRITLHRVSHILRDEKCHPVALDDDKRWAQKLARLCADLEHQGAAYQSLYDRKTCWTRFANRLDEIRCKDDKLASLTGKLRRMLGAKGAAEHVAQPKTAPAYVGAKRRTGDVRG